MNVVIRSVTDWWDYHSYNMMLKCWSLDPAARPSFARLHHALVDLAEKGTEL